MKQDFVMQFPVIFVNLINNEIVLSLIENLQSTNNQQNMKHAFANMFASLSI